MTPKFKRRYKEKRSKQRSKVDEAIKLLAECSDPRTLGRPKHGALKGCYGHDLDFRNRLLYKVDFVKNELYFLRVCSHKEVYGSSNP